MEKQLNFWAETPHEIVRFDIEQTRDQLRNLRRGVFARFDQYSLELDEMKRRIHYLESILGLTSRKPNKIELMKVSRMLKK